MKKLTIALLAAACVCGVSVAEEAKGQSVSNRAQKMRNAQMKRFGGFVVRPTSLKGRIVISNSQSKYTDDQIARVVKSFTDLINLRVEIVRGEAPSLSSVSKLVDKIEAESVALITDDQSLPRLLCAPENRWVIVNVAGLGEGAADEFAANRRFRCELARGIAYLAGAANSNVPGSLMTSVTAAKDLDRVSDEMPPVEVIARFPEYLKGLGITPIIKVSYRQACQEGWAPSPTNEYQQAIWNQIHQVPTKPITINFDPKTDTK